MELDELIQLINNSTHHRYLYHFTDESNFPLIAEHGLRSKNSMRQIGFWPLRTGGNELSHTLDDQRGISDYVSLCLTRSHPMAYRAIGDGRLPNPVHLAISTEVLRTEGVRVSFGVANANGAEILPLAEALPRIDTEVLYTRTDWRDPNIQNRLRNAEKMEILVPNFVPVELISGRF